MTSTTAPVRPDGASGLARARRRFRDWRRRRPFWGGLFVLLAGLPIVYFPYAHLSLGGLTIAMATTAGAGSLIIGILLGVLGVTVWVQPMVRGFAGIAAILLALVSIPVSNFGGFGGGLVLGLVGGSLSVAWAPVEEASPGEAAAAATAPPVGDDGPEEPDDSAVTGPRGGGRGLRGRFRPGPAGAAGHTGGEEGTSR